MADWIVTFGGYISANTFIVYRHLIVLSIKIMLTFLLPFAKKIVLEAVASDEVKSLVIEILKKIVSRTDNDLDDLVVEKLEKALFPGK